MAVPSIKDEATFTAGFLADLSLLDGTSVNFRGFGLAPAAGGLGAALEGGTAGFAQVAIHGSFPPAAGPPHSLFQQHMDPQAAQLDLWALQSGIGAGAAPAEQQLPIPTARPLLCQVPGCNADLCTLKEYYMRYKICPEHVQMHSMLRDGVPHRFCQQCGRFQPLTEFDEDRRTCRRKLERHNARRRKKAGTRRTGTTKLRRGAAVPAAAAHSEAGAGAVAGEGGATAPGALVFSDGEGDDVKMGKSLVETDAALGDLENPLLDRLAAPARLTVATAAPAGAGVAASLASSLDPALTALAADLDIDIPSLEELAHLQPHLAPSEAQQEQPRQRLPSHQSAPAHLHSVLRGPRGDASPLWMRAVTPGGGFRSLPLASRSSVPEAGQAFLSASAGASPLSLLPSPLEQQPQQGQQQPWGGSALLAGQVSAGGLACGPSGGIGHGFGGLPGLAGTVGNLPGISAGEPPQQGSPWSAVLRQSGVTMGSPDAFDAVLASLLASPATTGPGSRPDASPLQRAPVNGPPPGSAGQGLDGTQQNALIAAAVAAIAGAVGSPSQQPGREALPGGAQGGGTAAGAAALRLPAGAPSPGMDVRVAEAVSAPQPPGGFGAGTYAVLGGQQAQQAQQEGQQAAQQAQQQHQQLEYELELIRQEVLSHPEEDPAAWQAQQGQWGGAQQSAAPQQAQQAAGLQLQVAPPPMWIVTPSQHAQQVQQPQQALNGFHQTQHGMHTHGSAPAAAPHAAGAAVPPAAVLDALQLLRDAQQGQQFLTQERMRRLSMKLFNVGPEVLPPEMRGDLEGLLGMCPGFVETHLRPGCIHVALSGLVQEEAAVGTEGGGDRSPGGIRQAVETLLETAGQQLPQDSLLMVQLGEELAVVEGGRVVQVYSLPHCQGVLPAITTVSPVCLPASGKGRVLVQGHNIAGRNCQLYCRHRGGYPPLEIHALGQYAPNSDCVGPRSTLALEWIHAALPGDEKTQGLYTLEVQRGALLGAARPLLVVKDPCVVEELNQLATNPAGIGNLDGFLEGMGTVIAFLDGASSSAMAASQPTTAGDIAASGEMQGAVAVVAPAPEAGPSSEKEEATDDASSDGRRSGTGDSTSISDGETIGVAGRSSSRSSSSAPAGDGISSSKSSSSDCPRKHDGGLPAAAVSCLGGGGCPAGVVRVELSRPAPAPHLAEEVPAVEGSVPHGASAPSPAESAAVRVAGMACRLAVCAVARGWAATTALLLPAVSADGRVPEAVAALEAACPPGTTLLHLAVAARNPQLLQVLGAWGQQVGHIWNVAAPGGATGVTPVHLVAGMRDAAMLTALAELNPGCFQAAWASALTTDGYSPAAFAQLALGLPSMPSAAPSMPQQKTSAPTPGQEAAVAEQEPAPAAQQAGAGEQSGKCVVDPEVQSEVQASLQGDAEACEQQGVSSTDAQAAADTQPAPPAGQHSFGTGDAGAGRALAGDLSLSGPGTPNKPPVKALPYGSPPHSDLGPIATPAAPDCEGSHRAGAAGQAVPVAAANTTPAGGPSTLPEDENFLWSQGGCWATADDRRGSSDSSLTSLADSSISTAPAFDDSAELPRMGVLDSYPAPSAASLSEGGRSAGSASGSTHAAAEGRDSVQDSAYGGTTPSGTARKSKGPGAGEGGEARNAREGSKAGPQSPHENPLEEPRPFPADSEEEELVKALRDGLSMTSHEEVEELLLSQYD